MDAAELSTGQICEILRLTKNRVQNTQQQGLTQYPVVHSTTIWTDAEIEKIKKILLARMGVD